MKNSKNFKLSAHVRPVEDMGKLRAFVSVTFSTAELDSFFVINGIKVVEGKNGLLVGMPSTKGNDGEYHDICHPITGDFRKLINDTVLSAYDRALDKTAQKAVEKPSIMEPLKEATIQMRTASAAAHETAKRKPDMLL